MKTILLSILALILFSCKQVTIEKKEPIDLAKALLPEEEKRKVFYSIMDATPNYWPQRDTAKIFYNFYKQYYPANIEAYDYYSDRAAYYYALNEELINPKKINYFRKWARCIIKGSFEEFPIFITIEQIGKQYYVNAKADSFLYNSDYNYRFTGETNTCLIDSLTGQNFFNFTKSTNLINDTITYEKQRVLDGSYYWFEVVADGKYNQIYLSNNYYATMSKNEGDKNTYYKLMRLCDELLSKTGIGQRRLKFYEDQYNKAMEETK